MVSPQFSTTILRNKGISICLQEKFMHIEPFRCLLGKIQQPILLQLCLIPITLFAYLLKIIQILMEMTTSHLAHVKLSAAQHCLGQFIKLC
jgi:hypothetical protein